MEIGRLDPLIYRGKSIKTGEWVEGYVVVVEGEVWIFPRPLIVSSGMIAGGVSIDPETLSLKTPFVDSEHSPLYTGDIVKTKADEIGEIQFTGRCFGLTFYSPYDWDPMIPGYCLDEFLSKDLVKIGNVFDEPWRNRNEFRRSRNLKTKSQFIRYSNSLLSLRSILWG